MATLLLLASYYGFAIAALFPSHSSVECVERNFLNKLWDFNPFFLQEELHDSDKFLILSKRDKKASLKISTVSSEFSLILI